MTDKTKVLKGNGHMNVSNVNSINTECITLTYSIRNFKDSKQVTAVCKALYELVKGEIAFDLETKDFQTDDESYILKAKIKSCNKEKQAHAIKEAIDEYIKKKGGQTTLDES